MPAAPAPLVGVGLALVLTAGVVSAASWPSRPDDPGQERLVQPAPSAPAAAAEPAAPAVAVPPPAPPPPPPPPAAPSVAPAAVTPPPPPPPPPPPSPPPTTPAPAPPPAPAPAAAPGPSAAEYADRLVVAVNGERTERGLPALARDACADPPARRQAERMAARGSLSHQDLGAVLDACGGSRAAENVGSGDVTPERLVELWMASDGHRRNVLDPALTHLGSGAVRNVDGRWFASHVFLGR